MPRGMSQRQGRRETWRWLLRSRADFIPLEEGKSGKAQLKSPASMNPVSNPAGAKRPLGGREGL